MRKSSFNSFRVINGSSNTTKSKLRAMVHWPIVMGVNILNTYVTLVMGEVPNNAFVINAIPKALTNKAVANKQ